MPEIDPRFAITDEDRRIAAGDSSAVRRAEVAQGRSEVFRDRRAKPAPRTKTEHYQHLVEHHGHDDYADNPGMRRWTKQDYIDQHAEAHDAWGANHSH